ncbi:hypothetical protein San01_33010 [Streptomyces angustmyceticus]|uniref:Uncharacterized protein n=1 Tax=Streptomyces angustmyceticus TaxID=285578 RepID=A0A5J4LE71_9ACTN|nr:hypothetical protein San01_33010 [Streptomyces angustmyceticus]
MTTNIRNRLPHVIGASVLVVALTGTVSAIDAMSSETASQAQASSSAPEVNCKFRIELGKVVAFPRGCRLPGGGGISATLDGGLTAVTTMNTAARSTGATTGGR